MPEIKSKKIMVHIEEPLHQIVEHHINMTGESYSAYARAAIILDLKRRGLLPSVIETTLLVGLENVLV